MDFVGTNTEVFWFLPEHIFTYTLSLTLWRGISRLTARVRAASLIKVGVTLQGEKWLSLQGYTIFATNYILKSNSSKNSNINVQLMYTIKTQYTSSVTTPERLKYRHAAIGYPPLQPNPHKKPQHDKRSLTDREIFCNKRYWCYARILVDLKR